MAGGKSDTAHNRAIFPAKYPPPPPGARRDSCGKCNYSPTLPRIESPDFSCFPECCHTVVPHKITNSAAGENNHKPTPHAAGRLQEQSPEREDSQFSELHQSDNFEPPLRPDPPGSPGKPGPNERHRSQSSADCRRCRRLYRAQMRLYRLREEVLTTREHYHVERRKLIHIRGESLESNEELIKLQEKAKSPEGMPDDVAKLNILFQRVVQLFQEVIAQADIIRDLETKLGRLEYHLKEKEAKLYEQAFSPEDAAAFDGDMEVPDPGDVSSFSDSDDESERLPSTLEAYHDCVNTMNDYLLRLQELEDEHADDVRNRNEALELGQPLDPPQSVFERDYINNRTEMIKTYFNAKNESQQQAKLCLEAGYVVGVDDNEYGAGLDHSRRVTPANLLGGYEAPTDGDRRGYSGLSPVERMLLGSATPQERVVAWLRETLHSMSSRNPAFEQGARAFSEGIPEPLEPPHPAMTLDSATDIGQGSSRYFDSSASLRLARIDEQTPDTPKRETGWFPELNMKRAHSDPHID